MILLKEIKKHPQNYLILGIIFLLVLFLLFYFYLSFDYVHLRRLIFPVILIYLGWSVFHHHRRHDLNLSIFLEYLLIALLALVVVLRI